MAFAVSDPGAAAETGTAAHIAPPAPVEPPPPLPKDEDSVALIARAEARWAALIAQDFAKAYHFESPTTRTTLDEHAYRAKFGPLVKWHAADVRRLDYESDGSAKLGVAIDRSYIAPFKDEPIRGEGLVWERWIKENGEWWHNSRWSNIPGRAAGGSSQQQ